MADVKHDPTAPKTRPGAVGMRQTKAPHHVYEKNLDQTNHIIATHPNFEDAAREALALGVQVVEVPWGGDIDAAIAAAETANAARRAR